MKAMSGTTRLDKRGRLVLPAALRHRLGMRAGDEMVIREEVDGSLCVQSRRTAARSLIGLAGAADHSMTQELRAERKRDAAAEDADAQRWSR